MPRKQDIEDELNSLLSDERVMDIQNGRIAEVLAIYFGFKDGLEGRVSPDNLSQVAATLTAAELASRK